MDDDAQQKFDPASKLIRVNKGALYLETKWRIVWLREEFPKSTIETEMVRFDDTIALFRCRVTKIDEDGVIWGYGDGFGSCTPKKFLDYLERAETRAQGRALAAVGYGTAAIDDVDHIADAPIESRQARQDRPGRAQSPPRPVPLPRNQPAPSERQDDPQGHPGSQPAPAVAADGGVAATKAAEVQWQPGEKPWVNHILQARSGERLDAIDEAMGKGNARTRMLMDLLEVRRQEVG